VNIHGRGTSVFSTATVTGSWKWMRTPDDVLALMDSGADGVVAYVEDAGATFLAPIFDELTAIVCPSGTLRSHIGIVSREFGVPCVMGCQLDSIPDDGTDVAIDCGNEEGTVAW
jgi:signal transduction protein with GAF and PtsI domain